MIELLPRVEKEGKLVKDPGVHSILYHDKNPDTLSYDYSVQEKTCGVCHPRQVADLKKTAMGHNAKQSQYKTWTDKERGPHNCGLWFVENQTEIAGNTTVPYTQEMARINLRTHAINVMLDALTVTTSPAEKTLSTRRWASIHSQRLRHHRHVTAVEGGPYATPAPRTGEEAGAI